METVIALILWWLLVAAVVIVGAVVTALAIYCFIMICVILWKRADEKVKANGRRY